MKRGNFVRKPKDLDLGTRYIRTDPIVLKAICFLFYPLAERTYHESGARIVMEDVGSTTIGYITPGPLLGYAREAYRIEFVKKELERILDGYPPWYSEYLILANGDSIPHPIKSVDDVARGGWIVAVALSSTRPTDQECFKPGLPSGMSYRSALTSAFRRVSHGLRNTQKAFPTNSMVEEASRLVHIMGKGNMNSPEYYMIIHSKLSKVFSEGGQRGSWVYDNVKDYASGLSNEKCMMAIEIFSRYEDQLSEEVVVALEPILLVVLRAVMVGCYQVVEYFDRRGHFEDVQLVKVLKELESKRKPIYLREWKVGDEE